MIAAIELFALFKDLGAPVATIIAATVIASVTISIQRQNHSLAQERFRLDLFDKRYKLLLDTKRLIQHVTNLNSFAQHDPNLVQSLYISMDEGRFLLSPETRDFLQRVHNASETFLEALALHSPSEADLSDERWYRAAEDVALKEAALRGLYAKVPFEFERDLRISTRSMRKRQLRA